MELVLSDDEKMVVRFDRDDEVVSGLADFTRESGIDAAYVYGIGGATEVELGFYLRDKKEYQRMLFTEPMEIINVTGNIGLLDGEPVVHLHGVFGFPNYQTVGGHVHKLVVSSTAELMLDTMGGELKREPNEETGLNLLVR